VTVQAAQPGNAIYSPADPVSQQFFVQQPAVVIQTIENAASYARGSVAPDEFVTIFGTGFSTQTASGDASRSQQLAGVTVTLYDTSGKWALAGLSYVSPSQINLVVPEGLAAGPATLFVANGTDQSLPNAVTLAAVSPGLFTADASGTGPAAAFSTVLYPDNTSQSAPVSQCGGDPVRCVTVPIDLSGPGSQVYLTLYGTGLRGSGDLANVSVTIGGTPVKIAYSGAQSSYPGLDQVNVELPPALAGQGQLILQLTVQGIAANPVQVAFK
jgi:uncharacterized protein (TIGR03437 family)